MSDHGRSLRAQVFRERQCILAGPGKWDFAKAVADGAVIEFRTSCRGTTDSKPLHARLVLAADRRVASGESGTEFAFVAAVSLDREVLTRWNKFTAVRREDHLHMSWIYGAYSLVYRENLRGRYFGASTYAEALEKFGDGMREGYLRV